MNKEDFDEPCLWKKSKKKEMDLKEGENVCQCCNGWGVLYDANRDYILECKHCWGYGKLDWVENVKGKKYKNPLHSTSGGWGTSGCGHSHSNPSNPPHYISQYK